MVNTKYNHIDYILCSQIWRSSTQSAKTRLGADCSLGHELLIAKFRLKLKKAEETIRPFRYDLNQIPNDYTVEVANRFKWLDLIDRVPENYGWRFVTLYWKQWSRPSPRRRNTKRKKKKVVWGGLTNNCEKKRSERQKRERGRYTQLNAEFQRTTRRDKKAFLNEQCKEIEENNRTGKTRDLLEN